MDELATWLTGVLDAEATRGMTMSEAAWPDAVHVAWHDDTQTEEGEPQGSVSIPQTGVKDYRRLWQDGHVDDGWNVRAGAAEVWSAGVACSILARVEAERAIVHLHGSEWYETPDVDGGIPWNNYRCIRCDRLADDEDEWPCQTLRTLAYGHRFDAPGWREEWAPENAGS